MNKREACAWCGATDQLMVRLKHGTPVNACVDWVACGERELKRNEPKDEVSLDDTFGRQSRSAASLFGKPTTFPVPG